jgi:hypothetical protein
MNHPDIENQEQEQEDTNTEVEFYENKDIDDTDDIDADTIDGAKPIQWVYQSSCWVERVYAEEIES